MSTASKFQATEAERRATERHQTVLRVAVLESSSGPHLCTVRNISVTGLKAKVFSSVAAGEPVRIRLREDGWHEGTIVWRNADQVGIKFNRPLDGQTLSEAFGLDEVRPPRVPRVSVQAVGLLRIGARNYRALIKDVSPRGAGMQLDRLPAHGEACLSLPGLKPILGQIRWADGVSVGMSFNEVVPLTTLACWIAQQSSSSLNEAKQNC